MPTVLPATPEQRVILRNVSWETFLSLVRETDWPRGRFAYDQGTLEIMSPSGTHENLKKFVGRLIETLTLRLGIDIRSYGSTTLLRKKKRSGLEPDECYYIQNEPAVRGKGDIDLRVDPPPDLFVEVDLSSYSLDKFPIYSKLGVPEIWRLKDMDLKVYRLGSNGKYVKTEESSLLPMLPLDVLREFLARWETKSETAVIREFEEWVMKSARKVKFER